MLIWHVVVVSVILLIVGCGEHLTRTLFARECAQCLKEDADPTKALNSAFREKFLGKAILYSCHAYLYCNY